MTRSETEKTHMTVSVPGESHDSNLGKCNSQITCDSKCNISHMTVSGTDKSYKTVTAKSHDSKWNSQVTYDSKCNSQHVTVSVTAKSHITVSETTKSHIAVSVAATSHITVSKQPCLTYLKISSGQHQDTMISTSPQGMGWRVYWWEGYI